MRPLLLRVRGTGPREVTELARGNAACRVSGRKNSGCEMLPNTAIGSDWTAEMHKAEAVLEGIWERRRKSCSKIDAQDL